jgi:adenosylcobinamide-GDP ribazoletransferase
VIDRLAVAHALLTRLPVPGVGTVSRERLLAAAPLFPVVGLTVGGVAALGRLAADPLGAAFAAVVALALAALITGAMHEDGLADTFDALGPRDRARRLEAMRDSRIGAFGVLALGFVLVGRVVLLGGIGAGDAALALVAANVLARGATVLQAGWVAPAREDGSGAQLRGLGPARTAAGGILAAAIALPALIAITPWAVAAIAVAAALTAGLAAWWRHAFGGVTGDTHGATAQLVELAVYVAVIASVT